MHTTTSTKRSSGCEIVKSWREESDMSEIPLRGRRNPAPVGLDDVEQRLALEVGVERQRTIRQTVLALEIGRHPGIAVAQSPCQDRLRAHDIADRSEELIGHRRDHGIASARLARQLIIDHVKFGNQYIELERGDFRKKLLQGIAIDDAARE